MHFAGHTLPQDPAWPAQRHTRAGYRRKCCRARKAAKWKRSRAHKPAAALATRVEHLAFEHGLLLLTCGASTVRIAPPLLITRPEVKEGLAIFEHVVGLAAGELG